MRSYTFLSGIPVIRNRFTLKILFVAFVGIHIPLFAVIAYLLNSSVREQDAWTIGLLTLGFTLLATLLTLLILNSLLKPVISAKNALNSYIRQGKLPGLPTHFTDEAGILMHDVQNAVNTLESYEEQRMNVTQLLSHDLLSPLRSILSLINFMKYEGSQKEFQENTELIEQSLRQQLTDVKAFVDILKTRKLISEERIQHKQVNLPDYLKEVGQQLKLSLNEKRLELYFSTEDKEVNLPENILRRTLVNVLENAIKFSPADSMISIHSTINKNVLSISVQDKGEGFEANDIPKIFHYNSSLRLLNAQDLISNGVGLHLCQKLMNQAGGEIIAESEGKGRGATFTIKVPVKVVD